MSEEKSAFDAEDAARKISDIRNTIEATFSTAADALSNGGDHLYRLTQTFENYAKGLDEFPAAAVTGVIRDLVAKTNEVAVSQQADAAALDAIGESLARAGPALTNLAYIVDTIEYSASTARVIEVQEILAGGVGFSDEIKLLALKSKEAYANLCKSHEELRARTSNMLKVQNDFSARHLGRLKHMGETLEQLIDGLTPKLVQSNKDSQQRAGLVDKVSRRISTAIMALQVGDSFRQRLEHVEATLHDIADPSAGPSEDPATSVIRLIIEAQLAGAGKTLASELDQLSRDLAEIADLTHDLLKIADIGAADSRVEIGPILSSLREHSSAGLAVLYASQAQSRVVDRQSTALMTTIRNMEDVINELAEIDKDLRLASLNVLLRSKRAGQTASAMQVVARNFGDLTSQCSDFQNSVLRELVKIRKIADKMDDDRKSPVSAGLLTLGEGLSAINNVLTLSDNLHSELNELIKFAPRAVEEFSACGHSLRQQHSVADSIAEIGATVSKSIDKSRLGDFLQDPETQVRAEAMRARYSVPEERQIHDDICPPTSKAPRQATPEMRPVTQEKPEEEDFEWF